MELSGYLMEQITAPDVLKSVETMTGEPCAALALIALNLQSFVAS